MLNLEDAINLLLPYVSANQEAKQRINLVCERYLKSTDCYGSLERVTFTVTADANGEGFIELPDRYESIRGAVENPTETSVCGTPVGIRNSWYEYTPGNMGMIAGSDAMRGIIPIPIGNTDTTDTSPKYKVPVCPTEDAEAFYTVICKRAFQLLTDDDDILPVQNLGALKYGLRALDKEDAEDYARAEQLWALGEALLAKEKENQTGAEALGKVQLDDDFEIANIGQEGWGWGGYYG